MNPHLLWQKDLFPDTEKEIAKKYFNVIEVTPLDFKILYNFKRGVTPFSYRISLSLASYLGINMDNYKVSRWLPKLDNYAIPNIGCYWNMAKYVIQDNRWPKFIRPDGGKKEFAGQVFDRKEWESEFQHLSQRNSSDILCYINPNPSEIRREYRCLFVGEEYVDASTYMLRGEIIDNPHNKNIPQEVIELAKKIRQSPIFYPEENITIDICDFKWDIEKYRLVEINHLETSGWYGADKDLIYKKLAKQFDENY